jgi:hypothetical protein
LPNLEVISHCFGHRDKSKGVSYAHARCDYGLRSRGLTARS